MDTILELAKFNDVKYFDGPHKYYVGNKEYVSATTFIKKFEKEFENIKNVKQCFTNFIKTQRKT